MAVNPVNSGNNYVSVVQPQPQSHAERVAEKENEGNKADAVNAPPKSTVNTSGETLGLVINIKA
jgi:hypothetical protein